MEVESEITDPPFGEDDQIFLMAVSEELVLLKVAVTQDKLVQLAFLRNRSSFHYRCVSWYHIEVDNFCDFEFGNGEKVVFAKIGDE